MQEPTHKKPLTIQILAEENKAVRAVMEFSSTMEDPETRRQFVTVIALALESVRTKCESIGLDPQALDFWQEGNDYIIWYKQYPWM